MLEVNYKNVLYLLEEASMPLLMNLREAYLTDA